jgi:single-strand DNA-binding protein
MAAKSLNKVMLIGNVTRDPDLRYTPQGNAVCTFGLATNRSWKTDAGEIREEAEFHRLVAWNKLAELCSQLITRGRKIYVEGRLQTRTFTGSDNAQHTITEVVIDDMILLDSKFAAQAGYQPAAPAGEAAPVPVATTDDSGKKTKKAKKDEEKKAPSAPADAESSGGPQEDVDIEDIPF